jgi:hypothetical protein
MIAAAPRPALQVEPRDARGDGPDGASQFCCYLAGPTLKSASALPSRDFT